MNMQVDDVARKPRILLAASGSVAAIKFTNLCLCFSEWAEVKAVASKSSLNFVDTASLPREVTLYTDEDDWCYWNKIGDPVLHIELRRWADVMIIAPLSANTLAKIAGGLCDNLLTCIVRAWDYSKPMFIAPAMNTLMWNNPFTEKHLCLLDELGITLILPNTTNLAPGAMAEPSMIYSTVRLFWESQSRKPKLQVVPVNSVSRTTRKSSSVAPVAAIVGDLKKRTALLKKKVKEAAAKLKIAVTAIEVVETIATEM